MRWIVQVSHSGQGTREERHCVEAAHWRGALERSGAPESAAALSSGLVVDVLEDGYRILDPATRTLYVVTRAADPEPTESVPPTEVGAPPPASESPASPSVADTDRMVPPTERMVPPADDAEWADDGEDAGSPVRVVDPPLASTASPLAPSVQPPSLGQQAPTSATKPCLVAPRLPDSWLVHRREENPSQETPITYREYAYAVDPGTDGTSAETALWVRFKEVCATIAEYPPGKFVQLAIFDHVFKGRPARPPLATLVWKDWRGDPMVAFPQHPGAARRSQAPGPLSQPPPGFGQRTGRRTAGELVGDLFEILADLPHQPDATVGAALVRNALQRCLPCGGLLIHFFDPSTMEFVAICASGPRADAVRSLRTPSAGLPFRSLQREGGAQCFDAVHDADHAEAPRWRTLGVRPTFTLAGLLYDRHRLMGAIELANPADGAPFTQHEAKALDYVCERLGEFLSGRPLDSVAVVVEDG